MMSAFGTFRTQLKSATSGRLRLFFLGGNLPGRKSDVALAGPRGSLPAGTGAGSTESISLPNISRPDA